MPLDLLLKHAGDYERTHQVLLHVLFSESTLAQRLGLRPVADVSWEYQHGLFDLALEHADEQATGIEIKTWSVVNDDQAERQRHWARQHYRALAYILLGSAEYEGVPGDPIKNEHHFGAADIRSAALAVAEDASSPEAVRGLAGSYARWLDSHIAFRASRLAEPVETWGRLEHAVFYDRVRAAVGWDSSIYPSNNPGGPVYILNFDDDWKDLNDRRAAGASLYWELVNGYPCFKFGPVPERSRSAGAVSIREELRTLAVAAASKHGIDIALKGRTGEYMSFAKATVDVRSFLRDGCLDAAAATEYLTKCRRVQADVARGWARRLVA